MSPGGRLPGLALATAVGAAGWAVQALEVALFGHAVVEALVVAILLGALVRSFWAPGPAWAPGIRFAGKEVLEVAIVLLGASVSLPVLLRAGAPLAIGILLVVLAGLAGGWAIGRALGLNPRLSILVACGNAICGNSAIVAVAPVIGAEQEDVAASVAFTAVLGVAVVLLLPVAVPLLDLSHYEYGALAGMTVYAVPQVLAATFPVSALSGEVGTLVKLVRVLLLGPVVVFFTLRRGRIGEQKLRTGAFVPWFIVGFLATAALRSTGILPDEVAAALREVSRALTIVAMAALGLGVDVRALRQVGPRVMLAVSGTLAVMLAVSVALIRGLGIG